MSRLPPNPDFQSEQTQIKMQMLQSNITRVISQNKKLQHLLQYSDHFPKLKQYTSQVAVNWQKLNSLIAQINDLDIEIKTDRDVLHTNINHYYEHINKNVINQIKEQRITVSNHDQKITEIKNKQKFKLKKNFEKNKQKYVNHLKFIEGKTLGVLQETEKAFVDSFNQTIIPPLMKKVEEEFQFNQINCRTEIGHLQNLLSYYNATNQTEIRSQIGLIDLKGPQLQFKLLKIKAEEFVKKNTEKIEIITQQIDNKLKGIHGEINWLQNKRRRQKRMNTKQSERLNSNQEDLSENSKLIELSYQSQELEYQLMGLGKYCDQVTFHRKILSPKLGQNKLSKVIQPPISQVQQRKMLSLHEKLTELREKIKQYDDFYKSFIL